MDADALLHERALNRPVASDGLRLVVVVGVDCAHAHAFGERRHLHPRRSVKHDQALAQRPQCGGRFPYAGPDEFDAPDAAAWELIQNISVEHACAEHPAVDGESGMGRGMVVAAKVAAIPDERGGSSGQGLCGRVISGTIVKGAPRVYNRRDAACNK
ncbi:MAG: hypothetical protein A2W68_17285 [Betaproteobacteria bacterium RIFCSPLOWO2_02_64_14]|nr:MAG: hypothetical protein A2W68_17285 [Betaproteobacteria bacterium RIFCSPLOWO2_02_64_14]